MTEPASPTPTNLSASPAASPSPSLAAAPDGGSSLIPAQTESRPDYLPESAWDATANAPRADIIKTAFETHAAQQARIAARPEKPDGYELKFPEGYTPPVAIEWIPDDPRVALLRAFAHKNNWGQAEFSDALTIEAVKIAADQKHDNDLREAEMKKLGANGTARVTAIQTSLTAAVGEQGAKRLLSLIETAEDVAIIERWQLAWSTGGASTYTNGHREPPAPPPKRREDILYPTLSTKG